MYHLEHLELIKSLDHFREDLYIEQRYQLERIDRHDKKSYEHQFQWDATIPSISLTQPALVVLLYCAGKGSRASHFRRRTGVLEEKQVTLMRLPH
jgi:hypothetical protein